MSGRSFHSLFMVASCAGAALGCYLVSLRVASERAALEDVETRIVLAQRDLRVLQTEIGTRGRLAQLERWNVKVLALSAPSADQFLERQLRARQPRPARAQGRLPGAGGAGLGAGAGEPQAPADRPAGYGRCGRCRPRTARAACIHEASLKTETREVPAKPVAEHAAAGPSRSPRIDRLRRRSRSTKKSVDKPGLAAAKPVTKPVRLAKNDPLAPLPDKPVPSDIQGSSSGPMNAPSPALVAPRPERLRLVGQRRQMLAVMHQRLMFGMLVYAGIVALIALRILWLAAFGDHAGRKEGLTALDPRARRYRRSRRRAAGADDRRLDHRRPSGKGHRRQARARAPPRRADAGAAPRSNISRFSNPASRSSTSAAAPPRRWSRRSTRSASRALRSSASRTGSIRRPASPRTSSASPTSTATASPGIERAFDNYLSDPRRAAKPLQLSISSRIQQALEHELGDAMTTFSAIGAAGVVMDVHTGEVLAMTSLPRSIPTRRGRARPKRASIAQRSACSSLARPSSRSPSRWRWTSDVIKSIGQIYNCPDALPAYGHLIHDTHPFGRQCTVAEIMEESSNIGTAQIADQLGTDAAEGLAQENGLPRHGRDRAQGARTRADSGLALGPVRDDDDRLRPGHRGRAAAAGDGLCDPVRRRHLSSADDPQDRPRQPAVAGHAACSAKTPAIACARCCGWW